jgi:hypothetical protein
MTSQIATTVRYVRDLLKDAEPRLFRYVAIGRLTEGPGEGPSATVFPERRGIAELTLTNPIEIHQLKVRIFRAKYTSGDETREIESLDLVDAVADYLYENFTLDGGIRNIDLGGEHSGGFEIAWMDTDEGETTYHLADITLPLIVDSATQMEP